ncbi:MAG: tetratricopeptide repeat protein [Alphaproteobacteria bacterium]|nr:tetratricopeptide repeat protein [Alphaproteobacteria bacterium]
MSAFDDALAAALADHRAGRLDQAEPVYRSVIAACPDHAEAHHLLAVVSLQRGKPAEAIPLAHRAVELAPDHAKAWNTLGNARYALADLDGALQAFRQAVAADPTLGDAAYNLATLLADGPDPATSIELFEQAAELSPHDPRPLNNLGRALLRLGRADRAEQALRRALARAPAFADSLVNLGQALHKLGRPAEAVAVLRQAPKSPAQLTNLGNALETLGEMDQAVACFREAISLAPEVALPHHSLLVTLPFMDGVNAFEVAAEFKRFGQMREPALAKLARPALVDRDANRRLRIAYLSPALYHHVLRQNIGPVLAHHHRDEVHVSVYAHVPAPDDETLRMQADADAWCFIHAMSDEQVAQRIRADRIDILVHPMGHWSDNRILVCARKPAPVQISYLCNSPTSGLAAMDATIVDPWLDYDGRVKDWCVETPVSLAGGFQVTRYDASPDIGPPPSRANGFVTFASFNNPAKLSDSTLALWASVLARVPGSRLLLKGGGLDDPDLAARVRHRLAARGVGPERLELLGRVPGYEQHLASLNRVDIMLDTIPFTGGRTSEDALWMGVPVVTLVGPGVYGRYTFSHLNRIGCPELAAFTADQYIDKAAALAASPDRLADYRTSMRGAMLSSSIMDFDGHCRQLEGAMRDLWRQWCGVTVR